MLAAVKALDDIMGDLSHAARARAAAAGARTPKETVDG
jgi:hypothetical protein